MARDVFGKANLPNEQLGQIWALADTQGRGALDSTEFIVAMHLIQSTMNGSVKTLPAQLPPALFEAAAKGPSARAQRQQPSTSSIRSQDSSMQQQQQPQPYTAQRQTVPMRAQLTGPPGRMSPAPGSPLNTQFQAAAGSPQQVQSPLKTTEWDVKPHEKANYDNFFADIDKSGKGFITGEEAVSFFMQSKLPEDDLALVWDLSDMNNSGTLDKDAFAVAMHLITGKLAGRAIPKALPPSLIPPAVRPKNQAPTAAIFAEAQARQSPVQPSSAAADLFGLDVSPVSPHPKSGQTFSSFNANPAASPPPSVHGQARGFVPSSSFGQAIQNQPRAAGPTLFTGEQDLMSQADPEEARAVNSDATELANLSNQISSLNTQNMQIKQERGNLEIDNTRMRAQKEEITAKLAQIRQIYDQEVKTVRALQAEQGSLRSQTKELAKEASLLEASLGAVKQQHEQIFAQLEMDRRENANIKERIRSANDQSATLKATLEKVRKGAKQQRGLVAINTKQLNTQEAEHERLNSQIEAEQKAHEADRVTAIEQERAMANLEQKRSALVSPQPSIASVSTNPFHRVASPPTAAPRSMMSPFSQTASLPFASGSPFVAPAVAGAALAGVSAGAAAIAFGDSPDSHVAPTAAEKGKSVAAFNQDGEDNPLRDDGFSSSYETAPTTANSNLDTFHKASMMQTVGPDSAAPKTAAPVESEAFENNASEFANEAQTTVHAPRAISPQAQNWSGMDPFTADPRISSPAPQEIKPRSTAVSNLGIQHNLSDDESVGTSVVANAPASIRESQLESRAMTPTSLVDSAITSGQPLSHQDVGSAAPRQEAPTDEHELSGPITSQTVQETLRGPSEAHSMNSGLVPGAFPTSPGGGSSEDEFADAQPSLQQDESSDDETIEQPGVKHINTYNTTQESAKELDSSSTHTLTSPSSIGPSVFNSDSGNVAMPTATIPNNFNNNYASTAVPVPTSRTIVPGQSTSKEFDEFDDLEEAQEADDMEDQDESFDRDEFDATFEAPMSSRTSGPTAGFNGFSTPVQLSAPRQADTQVSPARDFSEFAHYGSVLGEPIGLAPPIVEPSSLSTAPIQAVHATGPAFTPVGATATAAAAPPPAPSRHGTALAPPPSKLTRQISAADDPMLMELMDMGFDRQKSVVALERFNYDLGAATEHLLKGN